MNYVTVKAKPLEDNDFWLVISDDGDISFQILTDKNSDYFLGAYISKHMLKKRDNVVLEGDISFVPPKMLKTDPYDIFLYIANKLDFDTVTNLSVQQLLSLEDFRFGMIDLDKIQQEAIW